MFVIEPARKIAAGAGSFDDRKTVFATAIDHDVFVLALGSSAEIAEDRAAVRTPVARLVADRIVAQGEEGRRVVAQFAGGVDRAVFLLPTGARDAVLKTLDASAALVRQVA